MELTAEQLAAVRSPFDDLLGTRIVEASGDRVVATLDLRPDHHQPLGMVHGGVYATLIETVASVGATLALEGDGAAIGISNATDYLRPVSAGALRVEATPLHAGRTLQLWQVDVSDGHGQRVAHGKVKLYNRRRAGPAATPA